MGALKRKIGRAKGFKSRRNTLSLVMAAMIYSTSVQAQNVFLDLPSQSLQQSIQQLAQKSGIEIIVATQKIQIRTAPKLKGNMSVDQALASLLENSGLIVKKQGSVYVIVEAESVSTPAVSAQIAQTEVEPLNQTDASMLQMQTITLYAEKDRDSKGYDDVYEKNFSSHYAGKDAIERFKGTTPSDLLKGMSNVYSGDARNSGALDPNIRGMQGQGRVPVTIDGTEQSLTVWRGYNGANSRSYIDPNLISSLQVVKGAGLNSEVKTGIAGGVAAKTLQVDDIIRAGEQYGAEIRIEGANNTTKQRLPASYAGQDYRDVMDQLGKTGWTNVYEDPLTTVQPKNRSDQDLYHLQDQALRIAVATKQDRFDLLAAYAYRNRGNYFAGKKGSDHFVDPSLNADENVMVPNMAKYYLPNGEVTNSSSKMESYLLKGTWRPTDDQALQLTYRDSSNQYGEIMPSRIWWYTLDGLPQWPLSEVKSKAYNLEYKINPENQRWLNLKLNLWQTDTDSKTYSSGGFVNTVIGGFDNVYSFCNPNQAALTPSQLANYQRLCTMYTNIYGEGRTPNKSFIIQDTAYTRSKNTRRGVSLSNQLQIRENLNLTLGADLSKEKLTTDDEYVNDQTSSGVNFRMLPRAGRRTENQYYFNFDWQPTSWLNLSAGAKSVSYWSFDDYLNQSSGGINKFEKEVGKEIELHYNSTYTEDDYKADVAAYEEKYNTPIDPTWNELYRNKIGTTVAKTQNYHWNADQTTGKYSASTNPLLNGSVDISNIKSNITDVWLKSIKENTQEEVVKKKDHKNWAPSLSASIQLNKNNRLYINYNEAYRLPSLFETTLGFSASQSGYNLKPEHARNWEVAYVYNMAELLKINDGFADFKIAYFNNKTKDVIERNSRLVFNNIDKQKIAGWELASRYDNGKFFGDLSLVWNKQNTVCDESSGLLLDGYTASGVNTSDRCVDYGFAAGYLVNMALPEYQANLTLGTRLLDNKLELGTRISYFEKFENPYLNVKDVSWFNQPLQWRDTWTVDAYANYKHNDRLGFDLVGTNIMNQYYLDPISRSATPAPGRTIRVGVNYKF